MQQEHDHNNHERSAWVIDVNMGYGHSRAAHILKDIAGGEIVTANDYDEIPKRDKDFWRRSRRLYEFISRMKPIPLIGTLAFELLDRLQKIPDFYPHRDLSQPNLQVRQIYYLIRKGFGKHLIDMLSEDPVPIVTTFFVPAFFADYYDYPGDIYCVTTDADISRAWVPLNPKQSRINYFASNGRVAERLQLYGVPKENIFLTGFPLPKGQIGGAESEHLKDVLMDRICNLDPNGIFLDRYQQTLLDHLGTERCKQTKTQRPLTVSYCVGGAGAQRQLGAQILNSLKHKIAQHEIRLQLIGGVREDVIDFFKNAVKKAGLQDELGDWVRVPSFASRAAYFEGFNELMDETDILWTKPSELSFYTGLGLPLIIAPPIGSQEKFNKTWLRYMGGGFPQYDPAYTNEWLEDWTESGGIARMAWSGYIEAPTHGTYRIEDIVLGRESELHKLPLIV